MKLKLSTHKARHRLLIGAWPRPRPSCPACRQSRPAPAKPRRDEMKREAFGYTPIDLGSRSFGPARIPDFLTTHATHRFGAQTLRFQPARLCEVATRLGPISVVDQFLPPLVRNVVRLAYLLSDSRRVIARECWTGGGITLPIHSFTPACSHRRAVAAPCIRAGRC